MVCCLVLKLSDQLRLKLKKMFEMFVITAVARARAWSCMNVNMADGITLWWGIAQAGL